jgi:hypothetical protein
MTCPSCGADHHQLYDEAADMCECYWCGERYCVDQPDSDTVETPTLRELGIDV